MQPPSSSPSVPQDGSDVAPDAEAVLGAVESRPDLVELELPLDDSFEVLLRLAVADLAREAGLDAEQVTAVRDEATELFRELCRSVDGAGSARWHFEVIPGELKVVARPTANPADVAVRAWAPVPHVA
jgi:hypothetical protein